MNISDTWLGRVRAFVVRDFQLAISYRLAFFLRVFSILIIITTAFYISKIFGTRQDDIFSQWQNPLAAWITGLAVLNYFMTGFSSLATAIRSEQLQGTLEGVLMTPITVPGLILSSSAFDFVEANFYSFLYFLFGWLFFGVTFQGSYLLAFVLLVLTTLVLASLGILSASFALVFKRGDPFGMVLGTGSAILSGVFFPAQLLPDSFRVISNLLPTTYGLDAIRRVLIEGQGLDDVRSQLTVLIGFLAVLLPLSLWVFSRAVRRAKYEGSLIQY